jgi:hypothetical protein
MARKQYVIILIVAMIAGLTGGVIGSTLAIRFIPIKTIRANSIQTNKVKILSKGEQVAELNRDGLDFFNGRGNISASALSLRDPGFHGHLTATPMSLTLNSMNNKQRIEFSLDLDGKPHMRLYDDIFHVVWAVPDDKDAMNAQLQQQQQAAQVGLMIPGKIPPNPFTNPDPKARVSHPACPTCYWYKGNYQVYEDVPGVDPPRGILNRDIPNPAPGYPQGVQVNERGEKTWYIGTQMRIGPTDEEPFSPNLSVPLIVMKRIQVRREREVMSVPGVHGFGIGADGFVVSLVPEQNENKKLIPPELEGIPVQVEERGQRLFVPWNPQWKNKE